MIFEEIESTHVADAVRPANEFEHFIVCPKCRQAVDCADIAEVMRHADPLHKGAV